MSFDAREAIVGPVGCEVAGFERFELTITPTAYRMMPAGQGTLRMTSGFADGVVAPEGAVFAVTSGPLLELIGIANGIVARDEGKLAIGLIRDGGIVLCYAG